MGITRQIVQLVLYSKYMKETKITGIAFSRGDHEVYRKYGFTDPSDIDWNAVGLEMLDGLDKLEKLDK